MPSGKYQGVNTAYLPHTCRIPAAYLPHIWLIPVECPAERPNSALFHRFGGCKGRDSERDALICIHVWGCGRERTRSLPAACPLSLRRDNCVAWIVRLSAIAADQRRSACHARVIPSLFWWHVWLREPKRLKNRAAQDSKNVRKNRLHKRWFSGRQGGGEPLRETVELRTGHPKNGCILKGFLRLLKGPGNAGFPGRFFNRILSDPAQLYKSLLKISIFYYLRRNRWPKMSL